jgi:predicted ATP-grasp superfamily ATP-dependent carboligase
MNIEIDYNEVIPLEKFELGWRFDDLHNSGMSDSEKSEIFALSETESKRLNKIIDYYEIESNRFEKYYETDWFSANSENEDNIEKARTQFENYLKQFDEDLIISWQRKITLKTSKKIFLKYWTNFLYPSSDDVTIISEKTNWILFYRHFEVANIWIKK